MNFTKNNHIQEYYTTIIDLVNQQTIILDRLTAYSLEKRGVFMKSKKKTEKKQASNLLIIIRSLFLGLLLTLLLVAILTFVLYKGILSIEAVPIANTLIKIIGAFFSAMLVHIATNSKKLLLSGITGMLFSLLSFVIFSIISGSFSFTVRVLTDMGLGLLSGILTSFMLELFKK